MEKDKLYNMEVQELYNLMRELTEIEYGLLSFIKVLNDLERYYESEERQDIHVIVMVVIRQLKSLHFDISETISKMDMYILQRKSMS